MNCEIITIGDEYLYGKADFSAAHQIYEHISGMGFDIDSQTVISSDMSQFSSLFNTAMRRSDLIIVIGGFSNPHTGSSREAVAKALNIKMVNNLKIERKIKEHYELIGERFLSAYASLSLFPKNSIIFPNDIGVVYGSCIDVVDHKILILPGEPEELENMFSKYVIPHLEPLRNTVYCERKICLFGTSEDAVVKKLKVNFATHNNRITTTQKGGCTIINLRVRGADSASAETAAERLTQKIKNMFYDYVCSTKEDDLASIAVKRLIKENKKIATAESCTAGMLSQMLTDISGSSKVFEFGISAYSNRIKTDALGIPESVIERYGAISEQTAILMAKNVREMSSADIGIGITGVAGPDKSENKDVGTIYIAMADKTHGWVRLLKPSGITDREQLRLLSCNTALDLVRRYLTAASFGQLSGGFDIHDLSHINVLFKNPSLGGKNKGGAVLRANATDALSDEEILELFTSHIYANVDEDENSDDTEELKIHTENNFLLDENELENEDDTPVLEPTYDIKEFVVENDIEDEETDETQSLPIEQDVLEITDETDVDDEPIDIVKAKPKANGEFKKIALYLASIILPNKKDNLKKMLLKVLSLSLALIFIVTSCIIIGNSSANAKNRKILEQIRTQWDSVSVKTTKTDLIFDSFSFLRSINTDTIGWLKISNTSINHPVVLSDDNEFYLKHNIYKDKSKYGTIFADSSVIIESNRISQNITLYGNNFKDGSMFSELKNYRRLEYYKSHPSISLKTLYKDNVYKIFSVFIINTNPADDNSYAFNFAKSAFTDRADFMAFAAEARVRSIINTNVDVIEQDELLTLCTPTSEFDGAYLVVMARKVRDNENFAVDTRLAAVNPNPVYPAVWYTLKGLNAPDTTSIINNAKNPTSSTESVTSMDVSSEEQSSSEQSGSSSSSRPSQTTSRPSSSQQSPSSVPVQATTSDNTVSEEGTDIITSVDATTSNEGEGEDTSENPTPPETSSEPTDTSVPETSSENEGTGEPQEPATSENTDSSQPAPIEP